MAEEKQFGLSGAVILGLGAAIGFEIFVLLDYARDLTGPSMVSALFLCGLINLLTMLSYSELSAALPKVGGEYTYTKAAFGGLTAFMSGCLRWLASIFGAALAARVFARQLAYSFSLFSPIAQSFLLDTMPLVTAILIIVLTVLDIRGVKAVTTFIVIAFMVIFIFFLLNGFWHGTHIAPLETLPVPTIEGLSGFFAAIAYTFTMFIGMRALVAGAPQIKDPGRNIPRSLLLSTILLIAIYCGVAYVAVGVVPSGELEQPFLNVAAEEIIGKIGGGLLFALAGMVASVSSVSTAIMVQSSLLGGMSRDIYLPKILQRVHTRFGTRYVAVIVSALFVIVFSSFGVVEFLGYASSFASLLVFAFVNLSLMRLRKAQPHLQRPFKAPLYPITPIAGFTMSLALIAFPPIFGDVNAINALMSSLGLIGLVLLVYYLRMVGYDRIRIAFGGASLGIGILGTFLIYLITHGAIALAVPSSFLCVAMFASGISILAGILNITT